VAAVGYEKRATGEPFQALFCLGVTQSWFDSDRATRGEVVDAMKRSFDDLEGRFGVKVLGTFDDDEMMVGQSVSWPWTGYILAEVGDVESVIAVCDLIRETPVGDVQLWKYMRIEARIGSPLFFGTR
jgi:hypothetical protein